MTLTWSWLIGAFIVGAVVGAGLVMFYCTPDDDVHVCSAPGIELRQTVNGKPVVHGDSVGLYYVAKWGASNDGGWYDLLNGAGMQFRPRPGSLISLEIRPIEFKGGKSGVEVHD